MSSNQALVRVRDLPILSELEGARPLLRCPECAQTFSADREDYFMAEPARIMTCEFDGCGGVPLELVTRQVRYLPWRVGK